MSRIVSFLITQRDRFFQGLSAIIFYFILSTGALFIYGALIFYILHRLCHFIWPLGLVYLTWVYLLDLETFNRGGRRVEFVRNNIFFRYLRDYFPVTLVKTSELDPSRNYIFGYHPHGMFPDGLAISFGSEALQFSKTFPGIVPYVGVHSCMYESHFLIIHYCTLRSIFSAGKGNLCHQAHWLTGVSLLAVKVST